MSTAAVGEANELNLGITFLDCADAALIAMRSPLLSDTWNDDSVLDRMTVGGLVAHISSAIITAELYLPVDAPTETTATDAAGFYIEAMKIGDYRDGPDSELQSIIRTGSEELAATGQSAVIATAEGSLERVRGLLDGPPDRLIATFSDIVLSAGDYLGTRIIEFVVHLDDLAASVQGLDALLPPHAAEYAARVLAEVAIRHHGAGAAVQAFARSERSASPFTAL